MGSALDTIASFPTAIWTVLLGVVLVYWLAAMLGLVDIDALDVDGDLGEFVDLSGKLMALGLGGVLSPSSSACSCWWAGWYPAWPGNTCWPGCPICCATLPAWSC
ncbi:hypothetical protein [Chitiniphilus eburneus]|uniref:hypothetical protein n=1 Tax=Chitiniphilus eburneus TaxID=2571148 RepID=UPI001B7F8E46|nr:hypothetical protein [Chitiniphilus eburneus]